MNQFSHGLTIMGFSFLMGMYWGVDSVVAGPSDSSLRTALVGESEGLKYSAEDWAHIKKNCRKELDSGPFLYLSNFKNQISSEDEVLKKSKEIYNSERRLKTRAYYDESQDRFYLSWIFDGKPKEIYLPHRFILSVQGHIERALEGYYVDGIMRSDMGHGHFLMPNEKYNRVYSQMTAYRKLERYLDDPDIRIVYHTAEQFQMAEHLDNGTYLVSKDHYLRWRYYTRNLVGDNVPGRSLEIFLVKDPFSYNSIYKDDVPEYYWRYGFSLSANKASCFPFKHKGKTYYFDLSFNSLTIDPENTDYTYF